MDETQQASSTNTFMVVILLVITTRFNRRYCYPHVRALIPDTRVIALIASSLTRVENYGGEYFDINCGISMGSPLSPLLGSIFLKPLDDAMENLGVFYVRYVDEGCIMAKSEFKLRHAIKKMHRTIDNCT